MWKEAVVAHFKVLSRYFRGKSEENNTTFRDSPFPDRHFKPAPPEYVALTQNRRSGIRNGSRHWTGPLNRLVLRIDVSESVGIIRQGMSELLN